VVLDRLVLREDVAVTIAAVDEIAGAELEGRAAAEDEQELVEAVGQVVPKLDAELEEAIGDVLAADHESDLRRRVRDAKAQGDVRAIAAGRHEAVAQAD